MAKSDTTCELDTINPFINRSWVEAKRVQVKFGLTRLTRLLNGLCSCLTYWICLTWLANKGNLTILSLKPRYISLVMVYSPAQNQTSRLSGPCVSSFFINSQYFVSSNSSSSPQNSSRSTVTPLWTSRLMSLNPLVSLPLKSLADPSNISSPQNRGYPLYSLFTFTTS